MYFYKKKSNLEQTFKILIKMCCILTKTNVQVANIVYGGYSHPDQHYTTSGGIHRKLLMVVTTDKFNWELVVRNVTYLLIFLAKLCSQF